MKAKTNKSPAFDIRRELSNKATQRLVMMDTGDINVEERTVCLTYSSEEPVERYFGHEVLSHQAGAQDLTRLNRNAPLLLNHDEDQRIGVVLEAEIVDGRGKAVVKFSRNEKAEEAFRDVQDGILVNVSFRYKYKDIKLLEDGEQREDGTDVWQIDKYEGLEISLVSIPADTSVGVGRSFEDINNNQNPDKQSEQEKTNERGVEMNPNENKKPKVEAGGDDYRQAVMEIIEIGEKFGMNDLGKQFIENGRSANEFRQAILEKMGTTESIKSEASTDIGMSSNEVQQFNFLRALSAATEKNWSLAPFEKEVCDATAKQLGRSTSGFFVPTDVLKGQLGERRMNTSADGANLSGGAFIENELRADSFIDLLRDKLVVKRLGAQVLDNLQGNLSIPKVTGGASAFWVAEGAAPDESNYATSQVALSPKTVGAWTDISRKTLLQTSISMNTFVMGDIAKVIARAIDFAALFADGQNNDPVGVTKQANVNRIALGTNGGALTYDKIVDMETMVSDANADMGSLGYLTNSKVRGYLKKTLKAPGVPGFLWEGSMGDGDGIVNGYRCAVANSVPSNLKKGNKSNCSAMIFGNFGDIIIGEWGVLDIQVNPYGPGSNAGTVRIRALQDADIAIRHPESFTVVEDVQA